ncbi:MAG: response regulator transcription factor [Sphaerochaetaceae bacterium]|nr:response regulator transcription factor [Sphaerochaetaceae bacterium]MDC7238309.1 response regulator transcription factor [Sphaerochaetaceae bacterium]
MSDQRVVKQVLIIEDDTEISNVVSINLESNGIKTEQVHDGLIGLKRSKSGEFDLIILDIMLPGLDGISICKKLREENFNTPILMLTAKIDEIDLVLSLELGADDYMRKPFSMRELLARVKALIRRSEKTDNIIEEENKEILQFGELVIDYAKHQVKIRDKTLNLTVKEFELLDLFARNPGRVFSRADLLNTIWGYNFEGYEHTVNTHINRLRNKLEIDPSNPKYLLTVWGLGYKFSEQVVQL